LNYYTMGEGDDFDYNGLDGVVFDEEIAESSFKVASRSPWLLSTPENGGILKQVLRERGNEPPKPKERK